MEAADSLAAGWDQQPWRVLPSAWRGQAEIFLKCSSIQWHSQKPMRFRVWDLSAPGLTGTHVGREGPDFQRWTDYKTPRRQSTGLGPPDLAARGWQQSRLSPLRSCRGGEERQRLLTACSHSSDAWPVTPVRPSDWRAKCSQPQCHLPAITWSIASFCRRTMRGSFGTRDAALETQCRALKPSQHFPSLQSEQPGQNRFHPAVKRQLSAKP